METPAFQVTAAWRFRLHTTADAFAPDAGELLGELRRDTPDGRTARAIVAIDEGVLRAAPEMPGRIHRWFLANEGAGVRLAAAPIAIPAGEVAKDGWALVDRIARTCAEVGLCRHSYAIAIGGGAVLDAVGFAASLIHRGLRQIRLPTTTLAQCDAGLGVKNAVNFCGQKNFLGTFTPPQAIINDRSFLPRQDDRSWRAGIAEAVKVAIIKDAAFIGRLAELAPAIAARDLPALAEAIDRCAALHLDHITSAGDPFEQGSSRPLDFGHWSAHRLEVLSGHRLLHGEAVAIGVALDLGAAVGLGYIAQADAERCLDILRTVGFRLWDECLDLRDAHGRRRVLAGLDHFREHLGGDLTLAMPDGLGRRQDIHQLTDATFESACTWLRARQRSNQAAPVIVAR
ncbi:3-dehydroquinate synthase [Planctomycetota bacterium]|nr:3-dehydroquinate synthase [Planctomycetota bacterium]